MIPEQKIQFNFSSTPKEGYVSMIPGENDTIPRYDHVRGFGFVDQTCAMPPRQVHLDSIVAAQEGYLIREAEFREDDGEPVEHHNRYGLCFRVKVPPGAYNVQVRTTSDQADMVIAISGMNTQALLQTEFWDAAKLITNQTRIQIDDRQWSYNYVNGREYIDIEIEPKRLNCIVGISEIVITRIPQKDRPEHQLPTVFTLGDSTVKSYIFEEAPMSGWGQVFDNLFDPLQVRVINYSMGGRSFKSAYTEGRFNDILMTAAHKITS
ncbi:hypothetical protein [Paenibacillus sp. MABNR03]|uniref:hypothetical protein n=1 Tax=Paenibacillus sp. MABNR03 TaxID=3142626 RepID=UPI003D291E4E